LRDNELVTELELPAGIRVEQTAQQTMAVASTTICFEEKILLLANAVFVAHYKF
jgi:hypothetical protein